MANLIENYNEQYEKKKLGVWLDLSTYCNAKCPQCHRTNANGLEKTNWLPLIQWSFEDFKRIFPITTLQNIRHFDICGSWGDPIMNKDIFKIVEYIMENTRRTTVLLNTNGSFRNPDWWWKFGLLGGKRIMVMWAIEGTTQEQHSLYRQNTNLQLVLENMETFSLAGGKSQVFTVVFKHNEKDLLKIAEMSRDYGADDIFYVQSNRFYENRKFDFINSEGKKLTLERATHEEDRSFYWQMWHLHNEKHLERIRDEAAK